MANQASPNANTSVSTCPASESSARECETTPPANSTARMTQVSASALFRVAPWSVIRSMNSSYPPAKPLNGLAPPIFATFQVRQEHPVAEPFVADLEHRQPVPVQEEQHGLDPRAKGLDPVRWQPHVTRHVGGPPSVEPALAGEEVGGGQDARRASLRQDDWEVRGGATRGDEPLDVAVRSVRKLAQGGLSQPGALLGA